MEPVRFKVTWTGCIAPGSKVGIDQIVERLTLETSCLPGFQCEKVENLTILHCNDTDTIDTFVSLASCSDFSNPPNGSMGRHGSWKNHALSACRCVTTLLEADSRQLICQIVPRESKIMGKTRDFCFLTPQYPPI